MIGPDTLKNVAPKGFTGSLWILAVGTLDPDNTQDYDWVVATAGAPEVEGKKGLCLTSHPGNTTETGAGLWLMTRQPEASAETVQMLKDKS